MIAPPTLSGRTRIVLNMLAVAVVLRLLHLGDLSLWVDEGVTWWNATRGSWRDTLFAESNHPPVWWLVTRAWLALFPGDEFALRAPAAACGTLSVFLAYRLSLRLSDGARVPTRGGFVGGDGVTAVWVAAFAATNAFWIEYSQEARMYAALLAESLGLSLLYLRWLDLGSAPGGWRNARWTLVGYAALASLALHTNYFAIWPIAGHAVHAAWVAWGQRRTGPAVSVVPLLVAQAAAGLSFVPWFLYMSGAYRGISPGQYEPFGRLGHALWRMGIGPAVVPLDAPRVQEGPAAVFAEEPVMIAVTALLWLAPIGFGAFALRRDRGAARFVGVSVLVPVALVMAACVKWPLVHEKYLIFLAPFLLHLAVTGARAAPGLLGRALLGGLVLLHAAGLLAYHFNWVPAVASVFEREYRDGDDVLRHRYGKEQWREAHAALAHHGTSQAVVFLHAPFSRTVWDFYERGQSVPYEVVPPLDSRSDREMSLLELTNRYPALANAQEVILVLSHAATDDPDAYRVILRNACAAVWLGNPVEHEHPYDAQWGIRIFRYERPRP